MTDAPIIPCTWNGEAFEPANSYWRKEADRKYVVGERYVVTVEEMRSEASHRHLFAAVREAWMTLPEAIQARYPSPEALRKFALIRCGYAHERSIVCTTPMQAQQVAGFVKPMEEFAVVSVNDVVVTVWTAQSQSTKAMGRAAFQRSKDDVLNFIAELVGVTASDLNQNTGAAA